MAKKRRLKARSSRSRLRRRSALGSFSAELMDAQDVDQWMGSLSDDAVYDDADIALAGRVARDFDEYRYEVTGAIEPDGLCLLLGSAMWSALRHSAGASATWADLDVDAVLLHVPPQLRAPAHMDLEGFLTWLHHNRDLDSATALRAMARLRACEPPAMGMLREHIRQLHEEDLAEHERRRLARTARKARKARSKHDVN